MKDGEPLTAGQEGGGPSAMRAPAPSVRLSCERGLLSVDMDISPVRRRALEILAEPALWLGRGGRLDRDRAGVVFAVWRAADDVFGLLLRVDRDLRGSAFRSAGLVFEHATVENHAAKILSPGEAWFAELEQQRPWSDVIEHWRGAQPPRVTPRAADAIQDAVAVLRLLNDEVGQTDRVAPGEPMRVDPLNGKPAGCEWGPSETSAFWRASAALADALPTPLRAFFSAASGFSRAPDGVLLAQGPAVDQGPFEGGEAALSRLSSSQATASAAFPAFDGEPSASTAALRRWLRDVEKPKPAREVARYVWSEAHTPPPQPSTLPARVSLLRRLLAALEENVAPSEMGEDLDNFGAARVAALVANQVGPQADEAWEVIRRTEPSRFYWAALTLRNSRAVDGDQGVVERGPIRSLHELDRLYELHERLRSELPTDAPTPLEGPAFKRRLRSAAVLADRLLADNPFSILDPAGSPATWLGDFAEAQRLADPKERTRFKVALKRVAEAADILKLRGDWAAAIDQLREEPPQKGDSPTFLAGQFGQAYADALDRGAVDGAGFWRAAFMTCLRALKNDAHTNFGAELAAVREYFQPLDSEGKRAASAATNILPGADRRPVASMRDSSKGGNLFRAPHTSIGDGAAPESEERPTAPERGGPGRLAAPEGAGRETGGTAGPRLRRPAPPAGAAKGSSEREALAARLRPGLERNEPTLIGLGGGAGDDREMVSMVRERVDHWRAHFRHRIEEGPLRREGKAQPVGLSGDGHHDLDEQALRALADFAERELSPKADLALLDDAADSDVAWVVRELTGLLLAPEARSRGAAAPVRVQEGWRDFGSPPSGPTLRSENAFFLFFASKLAQRSLGRQGAKHDPERLMAPFKKFLLMRDNEKAVHINGWKVGSVEKTWLLNQMYCTYPGQSKEDIKQIGTEEMAALFDRALLFLSMLRVGQLQRADRADPSDLWEPISISVDILERLDPPEALAERLKLFLEGKSELNVLYRNAFYNLSSCNNLWHAENLGILTRTVRRLNNMQRPTG